jgi:hypothetical protein
LPQTLNLAAERARTQAEPEMTRLAHRPEPTTRGADQVERAAERSRTPLYAAAAVVLMALAGGVAWMMSGDGTEPVTETATTAPVTAPVDSPAATGAGSATAPPSPTPAAPVTTPPTTVAPTPAPPSMPAPAPGPSPTTPPAAGDTLGPALARITQLQQSGNVEGALAEFARIGSTNDPRVSSVARSVGQAALRTMEAALAGAVGQRASTLAAGSYNAAEQTRGLADAAWSRGDFVDAGTRALSAADLYRKAENDARTAAAAAAAAAARAPEPTPSPRAEASAPPPNPAATTAPRASALDTERPGIMRALNRYLDAYREMSVDALKKVYPSLPRETEQALSRGFRDCRSYDATFLSTDVALGDQATSATVTARTSYTCQPKTRQQPQPQTIQEIFRLNKFGGDWLIDSTGTMDTNRRR